MPALSGTAWAQNSPDKPLVIARGIDLNSLDPQRSSCDTCQIFLSSTYQSLVGLTADLKLVPELAESWEINVDQTEFTFHIDPKAKFSDGSPVEAKDAKWSLERLKNLKGGLSFTMDNVGSIEAVDDRTVKINLTAPNSEFLSILSAPATAIVNSEVAAEHGAIATAEGAPADTGESWFLENSAGSGQYVLASYKPNNELRLVKNPNYWGTPPAIGEVIIKQAKDAVTQAQMLETGAADIASQIDLDTAKTMQSPDVVVDSVPGFSFILLAISQHSKHSPVPLTADIRQAIVAAIDYDGLIDFALGGNGAKQASPIPNGFPGSAGLPLPTHDLAMAKEILAKAGLAGGLDLDVIFPNVNQYGVDFSQLMQKVQQDLGKADIRLKLQPVTFAVWLEAMRGGEVTPLTLAWGNPDYFGSSQFVQYFGMMPTTTWAKRTLSDKDPEIMNERLQEALAKALSHQGAETEGYFKEAGQEMINDRVVVPLLSPNYVLAYRKDIKGMRFSVNDVLPLGELSRQ